MGKLMYFGKRRVTLPYFAFIEHPCPAYKNPADYYRKSFETLILDIKHIFFHSCILHHIRFNINFDEKLCCNNLFTNVLLSYFIIRYSQIVDNIGFKVIAWEDSFIKNGEPIPLNELGNGTSDASSQFAIQLKKN